MGNLLRWIKNFLSERKQRVVLNGISSDWTDVISGVPQGSVLGQILFILYVNDLPDKVISYCKIFADGTKLYKEINNLKDYGDLQDVIYELCRWTTKWLLFFNANKCKVLHIGNNNPRFDYEMTDKNYNKDNIKIVDHEKDLGVIFQENLKFDLHISFVVNKANRILGLIKRSFVFIDKSTFLCLYKSLVRSHLDYGDLIWFPVLKGIYLSKALTCMKIFLYKQELLFCQGDVYLWSHCCMNNLYISHRSLYAPTYSF